MQKHEKFHYAPKMTVHYYPNPLDLKYSLSLFCTCANPRMQAHLWHHKISSKMKVITFNGYLVRGTQTSPVLKKLTARGHLENYCNEGLVFIQFGLWQDLVLKIFFLDQVQFDESKWEISIWISVNKTRHWICDENAIFPFEGWITKIFWCECIAFKMWNKVEMVRYPCH